MKNLMIKRRKSHDGVILFLLSFFILAISIFLICEFNSNQNERNRRNLEMLEEYRNLKEIKEEKEKTYYIIVTETNSSGELLNLWKSNKKVSKYKEYFTFIDLNNNEISLSYLNAKIIVLSTQEEFNKYEEYHKDNKL